MSEAVEVEPYVRLLAGHVNEFVGSGYIEAAAAGCESLADALAALGGALGRDPDRPRHNAGRIREGAERLATLAASVEGAPEDHHESIAGNLLVNLSNLHIAVDSNIARSGWATHFSWAMEGLTNMHAARLWQREQEKVDAVLRAEWYVVDVATAVSGTITNLHGLERPAEVSAHELAPSELPELSAKLVEAFGLFAAGVEAGDRDDSVRAAEWLKLPVEGLDGAGAEPAAAAEGTWQAARPSQSAASGGGAAATPFDPATIDWATVDSSNAGVCKGASSSDRLAYMAAGQLVLIGPDHPRELQLYLNGQPSAYSGDIQVKSATFGAGTMKVTGVPADEQYAFRSAIGRFSKKDVEFALP